MSDRGLVVGKICYGWWKRAISADTGLARKTRAELCRADTPLAALGVSATHDLNRSLLKAKHDLRHRPDGPDLLALIAIALAHVKEGSGLSAASRFGIGRNKTSPLLSGLRFDALIRARSSRALLLPLVRALAIIDGKVDVRALANDLYYWTDKTRADKTRADWCFDYYGVSDTKPHSEEEET